jgi:uncharacterized protein (UPF0276 family)
MVNVKEVERADFGFAETLLNSHFVYFISIHLCCTYVRGGYIDLISIFCFF